MFCSHQLTFLRVNKRFSNLMRFHFMSYYKAHDNERFSVTLVSKLGYYIFHPQIRALDGISDGLRCLIKDLRLSIPTI